MKRFVGDYGNRCGCCLAWGVGALGLALLLVWRCAHA